MQAICQNIVKKDSLYPLIKHHVPLWNIHIETSSDVRCGHPNLLSCFRRNSHFEKFQRNQIQQWMLGIVKLNHAGNITFLSCYQLWILWRPKKFSKVTKYPNLLSFFRRNSHFKCYIERKKWIRDCKSRLCSKYYTQ